MFEDGMCVILDVKGMVGFGGVMGGVDSEVLDIMIDLFIEVVVF